MPQVHVVVDSTANIPQSMLEKYDNLHVVSLKVFFQEQEWLDQDLPAHELFEMVKQKKIFPRTSQPAPGAFAQTFTPLVEAGCDVIVITIDSALSGTVHSARIGAQLAGDKQIYVIDSETTALGMTRMAQTALDMAEQGVPAKQIYEHLLKVVKVTHTIFTVNTLEYLHKGGRIGGAATLFGTILNIKPILYLVDGKVTVLDKVRSRQKAIDRILTEMNKYTNIVAVGVVHIAAADEAMALCEKVQQLLPDIPVNIIQCASVLGAHLGPGVLGLIFEESLA